MRKLSASLLILALAACSETNNGTQEKGNLQNVAQRIAQETIIVDGHIDVPYRLNDGWQDVTVATETGDFDYPRAVKGGLNAPFMSIYTPAELDGTPAAKEHADKMIDIVERIIAAAPEKFMIARSVADIETAFGEGRIALPLGMENGSPLLGEMENLDYFYKRGIRYITLAHSKSNKISDSSYDPERQWDGLSPFGKQVVERMNALGILVDISHVSDAAFWDVMEITATPVIASHSSARHFTPGFERNMNDDMIKAIGANDGVIMINFGSSFLSEAANQYRPTATAAYQTFLKESGKEDTPEEQRAFMEQYGSEHPYPFATLGDVLDHVDHVVKLAGIDHVGLGSDYDGVGDSLPVGLKDVSTYPALVQGMLERGYSEDDVKKVLSGNILRVWRAVEAHAAAQ